MSTFVEILKDWSAVPSVDFCGVQHDARFASFQSDDACDNPKNGDKETSRHLTGQSTEEKAQVKPQLPKVGVGLLPKP